MNPIVKIILSLVTMILAFSAVFIPPLALLIPGWIPAIASILGAIGIKSWRENYTQFYTWFKSKSIWGALAVVVPMILLFVLPALDLNFIPEWLKEPLNYIMVGGGGLTLLGVFHAMVKNGKTDTVIKVILIFLLPSLVYNCSGTSLTFQTDQNVIVTEEPQQLAEIIDAGYSFWSSYLMNKDSSKVNWLSIGLQMFYKFQYAIEDSKTALEEAKTLSDPQILSLSKIGNNYNLGEYQAEITQCVKFALFGIQTYYTIKKPIESQDTVNTSYRSIDPGFFITPNIEVKNILHENNSVKSGYIRINDKWVHIIFSEN